MGETIVRSEFDDQGPLPPGILIELNFLTGPIAGQKYKLYKRKTLIGRREGDIVINDTSISGSHALFSFENGQLLVQDQNSTNGTKLNGGQVWEAVVSNEDEVTMGETVIRVKIQQKAASASWADMGMEDAIEDQVEDSDEDTQPLMGFDEGTPLERPLPEGVKCGIQVVAGDDAGKKLLFKKRGVTIGRKDADFTLSDINVSRKHASIEILSAERVIVKDLRSKNGTYVNDKWVTVNNLKHGDVIRVGSTEIKLFLQTQG